MEESPYIHLYRQRGSTNRPSEGLFTSTGYLLRQILLTAAAYDLPLRPQWLSGTLNALANALSRFDYITIANLCPY
jgi:hypothetical protein